MKSRLATLEIRIKPIIKTDRKESLLDKFYKSAIYTALWWLSRFFLYLISFVRNQVVGKKRSTTQIASAAMLEPVLKYLENICTTMYIVYNWIRNYVLQWPTNISKPKMSKFTMPKVWIWALQTLKLFMLSLWIVTSMKEYFSSRL